MAKSYGSGPSSGHPLAAAMKTIADNTKATADALTRLATLTQRAAVNNAGNGGGGGGGSGLGGGGGTGGGLGLGAALRGGLGGGSAINADRAWNIAREQARRDEAYRQHTEKVAAENAREAREAPQRAFRAQQADRFATAGHLNQLGMGGLSHGMSNAAGVAGALNGMGMTGAANTLSRFAGPAGAVIQGVQLASAIHNVRSDPYATDAQKNRAFAKMMPGGETLMGLADSFNARGHNMALVGHGLANLGAESQRDVSLQAHSLAFNPEQARRSGVAAAYAGGSAVTAGIFDRGTLAGQTAADDAKRMLPYRKETAKAEREMLAATSQRVAAERELSKLQTRETQLLKEQVGIERELAKGGSGPERAVVVGQAAQNASTLQRTNELVREAQQGVMSSRVGESQAKGEFSKAQIREDKLGQADVLRDRSARSKSSAMKIGGMLPGEAERGDSLVDQIKANPGLLKFLPADEIALARSIDGEAIDKIQESLGNTSSVFKKKQGEGNRNYAGRSADLDQQADVLEGEAATSEYKTDTKVAADISREGQKLGQFIAKSIEAFAEQVKKEIAVKMLKGKDQS